jgi:hypothetical protein
MTTFINTLNPTPFGFYDSDTEFRGEADAMVVYVKRKLGDDILSVELTKKQIWACFEESFTEFGAFINKYQTKSELATLIGTTSGSFATGSSGRSHQLPIPSLQFLMRLADPYAAMADTGGSYDSTLGYLNLTGSRQDYDIYSELRDSNDNLIFDNLTGSQKTKMRVMEIMHFSPSAAYRFFDSTSAINYLNNEFSFESFTPETIFYVLPVFEDVLRAQMMDLSQRVRRSNYSYRLIGRDLRIYPMPVNLQLPKKLYIRIMPFMDPYDPAYEDETIFGVSNLSNVPYGNLEYIKVNSIGKNWVRQMTLALCKELLGLVRSKFKGVPIPNGDVTLNGEDLISQARDDKEKLYNELKELLESLTYEKLIEQEAIKVENMIKQLRAIPMPLGKAIVIG